MSSEKTACLTLEQLYQTQSSWRAFYPRGTRPTPQTGIRLTPLASQACDEQGIEHSDLMHRAIWQFAEPNISEEIQLMRHAAYMQMREDKMDCVLRARDAIISRRSDREKLAKEVEEKVRLATGTVADDRSEAGTIMTWNGKAYTGVDGRRVEEARGPVPEAPASFDASEGFAALYSQASSRPAPTGSVHSPSAASKAGSTASRRGGSRRRTPNEVLVRKKAIDMMRRANVDETLKKRDELVARRLEKKEIAREVELRTKAEIRDRRIAYATEAAKFLEERRQRRARRSLIKKFLKSAALQMTTLEDVEKQTELKALREQKRKDFVSRAERKHEFRVKQIQEQIKRKKERVEAKESRRSAELQARKLRIQKEQIARERILRADVHNAMKNRDPPEARKELVTALRPKKHGVRPPPVPSTPKADTGLGRIFVSPASFPSFGVWMLLQHYKAKYEIVNVQLLDDMSRDMFASHFSGLKPSMQLPTGEVILGVRPLLLHLGEAMDLPSKSRAKLLPSNAEDVKVFEGIMQLVEPLYYRALQYVLPLLTPLMRGWEAKRAEGDLNAFATTHGLSETGVASTTSTDVEESKEGDSRLLSLSLEQLVSEAMRKLVARGGTFLLGEHVSMADFALIPALHFLLLSGYPLPELLLDYLASFASVVPALVELEEPLCVLFSRLNSGDENPSYSPTKPSKSYKVSPSSRTSSSRPSSSRAPGASSSLVF